MTINIKNRTAVVEVSDADNLIRRYQAGESISKLSKELGRSDWAIRNTLVANGVRLRNRTESLAAALEKNVGDPSILARRYQSGESLADIGKDFGVKADTIRRRLESRGVVFRTNIEAIRLAKAIPLPDGLVERYLAGESVNQLSKFFGISRGGINASGRPFGLVRLLIEAGVKMRTASEAERLKWASMTEEQRSRQTRSAHLATPSPCESAIAGQLAALGLAIATQHPVGRYHLDIALHEWRVAVEAQRINIVNADLSTDYAKRLKYILHRGWSVLYVIGRVTNAHRVAEQTSAFAKITSTNDAAHGRYGMIRGNGEPYTARRFDFDALTRVDGF